MVAELACNNRFAAALELVTALQVRLEHDQSLSRAALVYFRCGAHPCALLLPSEDDADGNVSPPHSFQAAARKHFVPSQVLYTLSSPYPSNDFLRVIRAPPRPPPP